MKFSETFLVLIQSNINAILDPLLNWWNWEQSAPSNFPTCCETVQSANSKAVLHWHFPRSVLKVHQRVSGLLTHLKHFQHSHLKYLQLKKKSTCNRAAKVFLKDYCIPSNYEIKSFSVVKTKNATSRGPWLSQCKSLLTLDLGVMSSSPTLGKEPTLKKKLN